MELLNLIFLTLLTLTSASYTSKELKCLVCKSVVDEMDKEVAKINPKKMVKVSSYKIDENGNNNQKEIPYARSAVYLSDLMDNVCEKMEDYVRATQKEDGKLTLIRLMTENGKMNPNISNVDIIQDSDLNKSLKFHCEAIVEEYEAEFFEVFSSESSTSHGEVCLSYSKLCDNDVEDSDDFSELNDEL